MFPLVPIVIFCALACLSALGVVLFRRPVYVALGLLVHSVSLAAAYFTMRADLAAVAQIVIYSGAIVVLFVIVVALLPAGGREQGGFGARLGGAAAVFAAMLAGLLTLFSWRGPLPEARSAPPQVADVGRSLFSDLIVSFELTAPLLLASIVGAIVLWRRQEAPPQAQVAPGGELASGGPR